MKKGDLVIWSGNQDKETRRKFGPGPFVVRAPGVRWIALEPAGRPNKLLGAVKTECLVPLKVSMFNFDHRDFCDDGGDTIAKALKPFDVKLVETLMDAGSDTYGYLIMEKGVKLTAKQRDAVEHHLCGLELED